jgi:thiamine biosynthesis lipoprotein
VENGNKYTHIINPITGLPAKSNLLSATVLAADCMTADAYATAFMVMGLDSAKQFVLDHKELGLEIFFIYDDNGTLKTYISDNLSKQLGKNKIQSS